MIDNAWIFELGVRGGLILLLAGLVAAALKSAASRHLVWSCALAGLLLLPLLMGGLPSIALPILPAADVAPSSTGPAVAAPRTVSREAVTHELEIEGAALTGAAFPASPSSTAGTSLRRLSPLDAWWMVAILLALPMATDRIRRWRLVRRARSLETPAWCRDLERLGGAGRIVRLLTSADVEVPVTWGLLRPVLLLPTGAEGWSASLRRNVLLHELAHVRRGDAAILELGRLACALHWFNPIAWWALRRLVREAELASDDRVLRAGVRPSSYARDLIGFARQLRGSLPRAAAAMARRSSPLGVRVEAILDDHRVRSALRPARVALSLAFVGLVVLPVAAALHPEGRTAPLGRSAAAPRPEGDRAHAQARPLEAAAPSASATRVAAATPEPIPSAGISASPAPAAPTEAAALFEAAALSERAAPIESAALVAATERPVEPAAAARPEPSARSGRRGLAGDCGESRGASIHSEDDEMTIKLRSEHCELRIETEGEIEYALDDSGIVRLASDARIEIDERRRGERHRLIATAGPGGEPRYRWFVGGDERPFDADGRAWLAQVMPEIFRTTGLNADKRVARILGEYGVDGVFEEIALIRGDYVGRLYLGHLLEQADLDTSQLRAWLELARLQLGSDYELAETLMSVPANRLTEPGVGEGFVEATSTIGSDYELRRTLAKLLAHSTPTAATLDRILAGANTIGSDYEAAELLIRVADVYPPGNALPDSYYRVADSIGSDYELGRTLSKGLERPLSAAALVQLLETARSIGSDYELAQLLVKVGRSQRLDGAAREAFLAALETVGSTYEHRRAADVLARQGG